MRRKKQKTKRINLYLDAELSEMVSNKANESYMPKTSLIKHLIYVSLLGNGNNTGVTLNENGK